ncbi:glycosyltransferase family 4 protein [Thiothrix subterranea]|uniref:Glycosyltransferase family 4 protein n=1 Tax=Thiothrix subterranea TaxID=2735563 RepID=A0AA51MQQ9_9GAMM|nr:glycosyltransferase family 4 protein [Thiothrix subterranea]MDQ5767570.1 glycosyltransferase family 4 protein [Thiothrix subterranea]WML88548.1 glycosyltransferase family 4 protein [Thiothrix subterranea]
MRILLTANIAPFLQGGADYHINGLYNALKQFGFETELIRFPFKFHPETDIQHLMAYCAGLDLNQANGISIDRVISLQFPGYGIQHQDHWVWLMHQHRAVYELFDPLTANPAHQQLRETIVPYDNDALGKARKVFANSQRVADRLMQFNQITSQALYHPPSYVEYFRCEEALPYVFFPSRLESLKRQDLLIKAAQFLQTPVKIVLAGIGGQYTHYQQLVAACGVAEQVVLLGHITEAEKIAFYAHALAVCFVPYDEDYGYVTLEAMLSAKPVITVTDAGGPLEFVTHGLNGWICEPEPQAIAAAIDEAFTQPHLSREKGRAGRALYTELGISWSNVVEKLTAEG